MGVARRGPTTSSARGRAREREAARMQPGRRAGWMARDGWLMRPIARTHLPEEARAGPEPRRARLTGGPEAGLQNAIAWRRRLHCSGSAAWGYAVESRSEGPPGGYSSAPSPACRPAHDTCGNTLTWGWTAYTAFLAGAGQA